MRIGSRIFPYPNLNNNHNLSDYTMESDFSLKIDFKENGDIYRTRNSIILKNTRYVLKDKDLENYISSGDANVALIVECSASLFRKRYQITNKPQDIVIPIHLLKGEVFVSAYMYTVKGIKNYKSKNFDDDFKSYCFDLEPYSIFAADDGYKFKVEIDDEADNKNASVFMIIRQDDLDNVMKYQNDKDKIKIYLSPENYNSYEILKNEPTYNNVFFAMLVIPVLISSLDELKRLGNENSEMNTINGIIYEYKWFKSVCFSYKKETQKDLTYEEFIDMPSLELAQIVLNYSSSSGLKDFCNLMLKGMEDMDNESD
ncbi:MAG: hypothetical protein Q4C49_13825 [Bacillota bacterium]|nr:hypothetical protein [Bacillota bacterium]